MIPSGPHSSTIGTGEAVMMSTAHRRLSGHSRIGPTGVEAQSYSSMSCFISLWLEGDMGVVVLVACAVEDRFVFESQR